MTHEIASVEVASALTGAILNLAQALTGLTKTIEEHVAVTRDLATCVGSSQASVASRVPVERTPSSSPVVPRMSPPQEPFPQHLVERFGLTSGSEESASINGEISGDPFVGSLLDTVG